MKAVIFSGPSLPREEAGAVSSLEWRPPASQGDVFRAAQTAPAAIAIVDGYFDGQPSVWHKEILWAMSRGIHVFGAASMGALRAAELHTFGMRGIGEIFERYRDGIWEDDDEVAVVHGPDDMAFAPLSVPMVNARATIDEAVAQSVVSESTAAGLAAAAKSIFYANRQWPEVLAAAESAAVDSAEINAFRDWLPGGEVDLKRRDARKLLGELGEFLTSDREPLNCSFSFEWTVMWDSLVSGLTGQPRTSGNGDAGDLSVLVLDELRQSPSRFKQIYLRACVKQLALREDGLHRNSIESARIRDRRARLREALGLYSRSQLEDWMRRNDWTPAELDNALKAELRSESVTDGLSGTDDRMLMDELRLSGEYEPLKQRAIEKRDIVAAAADVDIPPAQLLAWYFETRLNQSIPADLDDYLADIGIYDRKSFYRMAAREYRYRLAMADQSP